MESILGELAGRRSQVHPLRPVETAIHEHMLAHYRAELDWTRNLLARMAAGDLEG